MMDVERDIRMQTLRRKKLSVGLIMGVCDTVRIYLNETGNVDS